MHRKKFDGVLKSVAALFKLLSHPDRLRMVGLLQNGEMDVSQLYQAIGVSQSVVSQHLKLFKFQGLVNERKEGTHVYYSLKSTLLKDLITVALDSQTNDLKQHGRETIALFKEMSILWQGEKQHSPKRKAQ